MDLSTYYNQHVSTLVQEKVGLKQKSRLFLLGEIITFLLFLGFLVAYTLVDWGVITVLLSFFSIITYVIFRYFDVKNDNKIHDNEALQAVYQRELSYLSGDFSGFADGNQYVDAHHSFTFDLDIFGQHSLFQRINRTITTGGSNYLAQQLSQTTNQSARTDAIKELAQHKKWRANFMALGHDGAIDTLQMLNILQEIKAVRLPVFTTKRWTFLLAWLLITGLFLSIFAAIAGIVNSTLPIWWAICHFFGVLYVCSKACKTTSKVVDRLHKQMRLYVKLIRLSTEPAFNMPENQAITAQLSPSLQAFKALNNILSDFDRRGNVLGMFITNSLFLSDFFLLRRFMRWEKQYIDQIPAWISTINQLDGWVSMATFRYNEPHATTANIIDNAEIVYKAKGLYHPFLGQKAVKNDFTLIDQHYYIITGANMAGKSTFLRALGINYVLAMNGMPVFADNLTVSTFNLFSSMRTTDDLAHGISYFNAEILRLQQLISTCSQQTRTLIILDEILKGTNSLDKLNGSKLFLQWIAQLNVTGVIATHDLELSKLEGERYHNHCFEIELGSEVTYTYRITPGVARNQNATFLLNKMLDNTPIHAQAPQ